AAEHVVHTAIFARPFNGADVGRLFHDTDDRRVTPGIGTDPARLVLRQITAHRTRDDALGHRVNRAGEALNRRCRLFEQVIREPRGSLASDAREFRELSRELVDDRQPRLRSEAGTGAGALRSLCAALPD